MFFQFNGNACCRQHDAQEFLVHLLEALQKDLSRGFSMRPQVCCDDLYEWKSLQ